jgi:hypothetical protein
VKYACQMVLATHRRDLLQRRSGTFTQNGTANWNRALLDQILAHPLKR